MPYKDIEARRACGRRWYENNKHVYLDRNKKRRADVKDWIRSYKETHPCTDCGQFFPYYVMDFDHLRDKVWDVGNMSSMGLAKVKEEIAKCELVCANCHRIRTHSPVV